ncbi:DUF1488 family protein [Methylobacillus arboreus]|uniref:DUF1488 family protein n=1 Tax=Methylobacillus arboreus TaxID=755170 RepID=UPI001E295FEF|nr:DUF1488 family protein [Methylobacillus arboreus]MCB5189854.1 DUF1488 family protein [Methylobacillus arboreus]
MSVQIFNQVVVDHQVNFKVLKDGKTYDFSFSKDAIDYCANALSISIDEDLDRLEIFVKLEDDIAAKAEEILEQGAQKNEMTYVIDAN